MTIAPLVVCAVKVPVTVGAVPPAFSTRPLPPVVTVIESAVSTGPPEKVPVTVFGVPLLVMVRVPDPVATVIAPAAGWAVNVPVPVAAVPLLPVKTIPLMVIVPLVFWAELVNVPVWVAGVAWAAVAFSAKTTKSWVQLGSALMLKLNFAGYMIGATCEEIGGPSETLQSP